MLDDFRQSLKASVRASDMMWDAYFNGAQAQLVKHGLAKPVAPTEHSDTPLWQRGLKLLFWTVLAYILGGLAWAVGAFVVLTMIIWLTKDIYKKEASA